MVTVGDLKKLLEGLPDDTPVTTARGDTHTYRTKLPRVTNVDQYDAKVKYCTPQMMLLESDLDTPYFPKQYHEHTKRAKVLVLVG